MNCQRPAAPAGDWMAGSKPLSTKASQRMSSGTPSSRIERSSVDSTALLPLAAGPAMDRRASASGSPGPLPGLRESEGCFDVGFFDLVLLLVVLEAVLALGLAAAADAGLVGSDGA